MHVQITFIARNEHRPPGEGGGADLSGETFHV